MHRLLVEGQMLEASRPQLGREASKHLKVVRVKPGEEVELFDGNGRARLYSVDSGGGLSASGEIRSFPAPKSALRLFACVTKGSRWDWTIEKSVELGVTSIVPVISERCIVRVDASDRAAKRERWLKIASEAARQSDAVWLPEILELMGFDEAIELVKESGQVFAGALMKPEPPTLLDAVMAVEPSMDVGAFVGPEGDFTPDELKRLLEVAAPVSFGPTILRAETAAIFAVSVLAARRMSRIAAKPLKE